MSKNKTKIIIIMLSLIIAILSYRLYSLGGQTNIKISESLNSLLDKSSIGLTLDDNSISCKAFKYIGARRNGDAFESEVSEGTDNLALRFDYNKNVIFMMSNASIDMGTTESSPYTIIRDSSNAVSAIWMSNETEFPNTITYNKVDNILIWQKSWSNSLLGDVGYTIFFKCY